MSTEASEFTCAYRHNSQLERRREFASIAFVTRMRLPGEPDPHMPLQAEEKCPNLTCIAFSGAMRRNRMIGIMNLVLLGLFVYAQGMKYIHPSFQFGLIGRLRN